MPKNMGSIQVRKQEREKGEKKKRPMEFMMSFGKRSSCLFGISLSLSMSIRSITCPGDKYMASFYSSLLFY